MTNEQFLFIAFAQVMILLFAS